MIESGHFFQLSPNRLSTVGEIRQNIPPNTEDRTKISTYHHSAQPARLT